MSLSRESQILDFLHERDRRALIWRIAGAAILALVIIAQGMMVWIWVNQVPEVTFQNQDQPYFRPSGNLGGLQTVTLINGQVFHGTLAAFSPGRVVLRDVFQTEAIAPGADATAPALTRRALANPSGPEEMALPADKIMFMEPIGTNSPIGRAITETLRRQTPPR